MRRFARPAALVSMAEPGGALEETFATFVALGEARAACVGSPDPGPAYRQYAATDRYHQFRREHLAIERKLADMVRRHAARWARYRGRAPSVSNIC